MPAIRPEPEALSEQLIDLLQRRIVNGQIPVGSWLRHSTVAEELGISRTPVREALRVLHARGVVTIVQNRGARVNGLSGRDLRELGEVRAELEGLAAELAASRINDHQTVALRQAMVDFASAVAEYAADPERAVTAEADDRWSVTNEAFHRVILDASGNRQLALSIEDVSRRLPRNSSFRAYARNSRLLRQNLVEHEEIAAAILANDARHARRAMVKHIRSSTQSLARVMED